MSPTKMIPVQQSRRSKNRTGLGGGIYKVFGLAVVVCLSVFVSLHLNVDTTSRISSSLDTWYPSSTSISSALDGRLPASWQTSTRTALQPIELSATKDGALDRPPKFALAFVVAGCDDARKCYGYVLNAVVASTVLRHYGSSAEVVFLVRMQRNPLNTAEDLRLTSQLSTWLQKAGIKLRYLPTIKVDNFGTATLEKFRVFELVEYDRVFYMDSDMIPLCNIDTHFWTSMRGEIDENLLYTGGVAPINAGRFIIRPQAGAFGEIVDIVHRHRATGKDFSEITGWGQQLPGAGSSGFPSKWQWRGAGIDQGINVQYFLFQALHFSKINFKGTRMDTWKEIPSNMTEHWKKQRFGIVIPSAYYDYTRFTARTAFRVGLPPNMTCAPGSSGQVPFDGSVRLDMCHLMGNQKPWTRRGIDATLLPKTLAFKSESNAISCSRHNWLYFLAMANETWNLNLPSKISPLPSYPLGKNMTGDAINADTLLDPTVALPVPSI